MSYQFDTSFSISVFVKIRHTKQRIQTLTNFVSSYLRIKQRNINVSHVDLEIVLNRSTNSPEIAKGSRKTCKTLSLQEKSTRGYKLIYHPCSRLYYLSPPLRRPSSRGTPLPLGIVGRRSTGSVGVERSEGKGKVSEGEGKVASGWLMAAAGLNINPRGLPDVHRR